VLCDASAYGGQAQLRRVLFRPRLRDDPFHRSPMPVLEDLRVE
jgi:hypothetical protein